MSWNRVAVVGAGLIKFGELFEQSYEQMAAGAFAAAVDSVDKGFEPTQVEAAFVATQRGTLWGQEGIGGNTIPSAIGLAGIPCTRIENACPSGSDAFRIGAMAVASGVHDVVLVIGVEKMRDKSTEEGLLSRAAPGTRSSPAARPRRCCSRRSPPATCTSSARREMLASVAVKNHYNGARDPYAHFQNEITVEDVLASVPVCHPLHLLDCCPQTDGAAAMLLVSAERAEQFTDKPVYVAGFGVATDHPYLHEKSSFTSLKATRWPPSARTRWPASSRGRSTAPRCTTASRSPRSSTSRTSASSTRARAASRRSTARRRSPVASRSTRRAACSPRATRSARPASRSSPSAGGSCGGEADERQVEMRNGYALQHNVGGRGSGVSVVNILTTNHP